MVHGVVDSKQVAHVSSNICWLSRLLASRQLLKPFPLNNARELLRHHSKVCVRGCITWCCILETDKQITKQNAEQTQRQGVARRKVRKPHTKLVIFIHRLLLTNLETLGLIRQKVLLVA